MVGHRATEASTSNMFGHKTEQPRDFCCKRDATSSDLSANSNAATTSISTASIGLLAKKGLLYTAAALCLLRTHTHTHTHLIWLRVLWKFFLFFKNTCESQKVKKNIFFFIFTWALNFQDFLYKKYLISRVFEVDFYKFFERKKGFFLICSFNS